MQMWRITVHLMLKLIVMDEPWYFLSGKRELIKSKAGPL